MNEDAKKFKQLIETSNSILVTSHISPDPDAVSSLVLFGETLKLNYPNKLISVVLEEEPVNLDFLAGYEKIAFATIETKLAEEKPDLFILLDGNNFDRSSRHDGPKIREYIYNHHVKTAVIDHHEPDGGDQTDVYINNNSPAAVQDVYNLLFQQFGLKKPAGSEQTAMVGLYADSGGFAYVKSGSEQKLFDFVKELVAGGAKIEAAKNLLSRYSQQDIEVLSELLTNLSAVGDFTYSFLTDDFIKNWQRDNKNYAQLQPGTGAFLNDYVRNIDGRTWGFIVYKNTLQGENMYSASFRAVGGTKDVAKIAAKLGGGGHKPAAGAKFEANSLEDAIARVKDAIENS